ncbi:MAG: hypothetical protein HY403_04295 [Elusimicrobia bacterium]|nr:hypothetical protein [Elusimicrobiota bacterium]
MREALLVYGYAPSGHSAAAFALEEAGRKAGLSFGRLEVAAEHHPLAGRLLARGYHGLLSAAPRAWGALHRSRRARSLLRGARSAYLALGGARRLREAARRAGAGAVVCTQAAVAAVLSEARARGELDIPVVSVLTDYGADPFWADPPADLVLAPSAEAAARLAALGAPESRVRATGIPVHPAFSAPPDRGAARRALGLPASAPVVLLTGGGKGLGALDRAAGPLLRAVPRAHLLVLCGGNDRVRISLEGASRSRMRAFGPRPPAFVALLMAAADLHLGKPGGLTSAESLAVGLPMVLARPLPGQEEDNARHLLAAGAAREGGSPESAAAVAARLLDRPADLARMRARAFGAGLPGAAEDAVARIAALAFDRPRSFLLQ